LKKVTAILLLGCLVFCAAGYHFVFRFQLWQAKSEMKLRLLRSPGQKEITELSFNSQEQEKLEWEDDHEVSVNGEMYDVIEQYSRDGKLVLRCIDDKKETALIDEYLKLNKNNSDNKPLSSLVQLIAAQFLVPVTNLPEPSVNWFSNQFFNYSSDIVSTSASINTPPPKVC